MCRFFWSLYIRKIFFTISNMWWALPMVVIGHAELCKLAAFLWAYDEWDIVERSLWCTCSLLKGNCCSKVTVCHVSPIRIFGPLVEQLGCMRTLFMLAGPHCSICVEEFEATLDAPSSSTAYHKEAHSLQFKYKSDVLPFVEIVMHKIPLLVIKNLWDPTHQRLWLMSKKSSQLSLVFC